jgi:hypothetical protein
MRGAVQFNGVSKMAEHLRGCNSFSRHLRVFCNRRNERVTIRYRDRKEWANWRKRPKAGSPMQNP